MSSFYEKINKNAEKIAHTIAKQLPNSTLDDLLLWVENNFQRHVKIRYSDLSKGICSGLVYFDPKINSYRIFIEKSDSTARQRFTIGHEIGHIIANWTLQYGFFEKEGLGIRNGQERFCNRFSAAFLMPQEQFIKFWNFNFGMPEGVRILQSALKFRVSADAARYRAIELGLLNIKRK